MNKQYSSKFKTEVVKKIEKTGEVINKLAPKLGVIPMTMQECVKK